MKKAAILSLTAFYLLLSTGMYLCMMHCAAADVIRIAVTKNHKPAMAGMHCCEKPAKKIPAKNKDCTDKHSNYLVKENIKPVAGTALQLPVAYRAQLPAAYSTLASAAINPVNTSARGPAPPLKSGRAYLIQIRSLLI